MFCRPGDYGNPEVVKRDQMKVTIITDVLNSRDTIEDTIKSILSQTYSNIEYIVVDGVSGDGTVEIVNKYADRISKFVSEKDLNHFDAMNKGLKMATGEVVGFLHADDFFAGDDTIEKVAGAFVETGVDCLWGDLDYVDKRNVDKVIRHWVSCAYRDGLFEKGWMPPHPAFFVKRWAYERYGYFNIDLPIASDYEIMMRFLYKNKLSGGYIPEVLVKMRTGGLSNKSLGNLIRKTKEDLRACGLNDLPGGVGTIARKNISKIPQFFAR